MSKLNQIQNALMEIDQAGFQKLIDSYLHRTLDIKEISSVGSVAGEDKTRTGQPDTLITLKNDKYVFLEATTEKSGLLAKFSADLDECFDEDKTGISLTEVEKIILACNRKLSHKDKSTLIKKGQDKGCIVESLDLDMLSFELYQKFQPLAKEFLGIELDTGQILKPIDFIEDYQKSKFATPLDNEFFFREKEKEQILEALEKQDLIIISGKAGVGKSKLALECMSLFVDSHPNFQAYAITNKNLDLYENLKGYFGADGSYLILVDDANRLSQLYHILRLLNEQTDTRKIKIILTVRDYALNQVRNELKQYFSSEIELQKFSKEEITKILDEGFGIKNYNFIDRIYDISNGNSRLAIMAAKVALEKDRLDSINDVTDLYDIYFESINDDLKELGNEDLIQIAGIISFFRTLDRTKSDIFETVAQSFGFTADELWLGLEKLHELEVIDLDFEVAKISDQILGTYLFYRAFFRDEVLDVSILLSNFFEKFSYRLVDSLNPVLNTFNATSIIEKLRPHIDRRWTEIKEDEGKVLAFMKHFHFLKETEFLIYLKQRIDLIDKTEVSDSDLQFTPRSYEPVNDVYLNALKLFQGKNIAIVLDLLFDYLERNLNLLPQVVYLLTHDFCFNHISHYWNYVIQQNVVSKLIEKSKGEKPDLYQKIFLKVAETYTKMRFHSNTSNGLTVTVHKVPLRPTEAMIELRNNLWNRLIEIYHEEKYQKEVCQIIKNYNSDWHKDFIVKEIIENDKEILLPFITSLNSESYQDCVIANAFFDFLENVEVDFDKSLRAKFTNKTFEISEVFLSNDRRELKLGYEEYEKYKQNLLETYFDSYKFEDYQELFKHCEEIQSFFTKDRDFYQLHYPLINVLLNLAEKDKELYIRVIDYLIKSGNPIYLAGNHIINKLIEKTANPIEVYESLNEAEFNGKSNWLFGFFESLSKETADVYFLGKLYKLYRNANLNEIPQRFDYLDNYLHLDKNAYITIIKIIFERVKKGEGYFNFHYLFNPYGDTFKKFEDIFVQEIILSKNIYFHQSKVDLFFDYKSSVLRKIFNLDNNFLFEYLEFLYSGENSSDVFHDREIDWSFIWEQTNYKELFKSLLEFVYKKDKEDVYFWRPSYIELAFRTLNDEQKEKAVNLLKEIMGESASDKNKASYIFQLVVNCFGDKKKEFLEVFLNENKNYDDFKGLPSGINYIVMADMGSRIPNLENKIKFYESLLPLFNSIELLDHKLYIEEKIKNYKQDIEDARKSDFIGQY
jgi:hypothetical protein